MLSIPTARPISICPERILLAMSATAINPLEQNLLRVWTGTVSGKPAARAAVRAGYMEFGVRTVPTAMSCTSEGSILEYLIDCYGR